MSRHTSHGTVAGASAGMHAITPMGPTNADANATAGTGTGTGSGVTAITPYNLPQSPGGSNGPSSPPLSSPSVPLSRVSLLMINNTASINGGGAPMVQLDSTLI